MVFRTSSITFLLPRTDVPLSFPSSPFLDQPPLSPFRHARSFSRFSTTPFPQSFEQFRGYHYVNGGRDCLSRRSSSLSLGLFFVLILCSLLSSLGVLFPRPPQFMKSLFQRKTQPAIRGQQKSSCDTSVPRTGSAVSENSPRTVWRCERSAVFSESSLPPDSDPPPSASFRDILLSFAAL